MIGVSKTGYVDKIEFIASKEQVGYILTKPLHSSQEIKETRDDGSVVFEIAIEPNVEFYQLMMSISDSVKVLSPQRVVNELQRRLNKAISQYD